MGVKLQSSSGGSVEIAAPVTASNYTLTAPAANGTILNDASSLAAAMLTGNVDVARLVSAFSGSNVSLGASGYQKLPSGLIIQWYTSEHTQVSTSSGETWYVTLPTSFPIAHLQAFGSVSNGATSTAMRVVNAVAPYSASQAVIESWTNVAGLVRVRFISIGY